MSESLCICGHLTSDHESLGPWPVESAGSPCNRCNADPAKATRLFHDMLCVGYAEWQIEDIPYPAAWSAVELGCTCSVGLNVERAKSHASPIYDPECPIHEWVCKRDGMCAHDPETGASVDLHKVRQPESNYVAYIVDHSRTHATCEHCTVPKIECEQCGRVWGDWRMGPLRGGWELIHRMENEKAWRCSTCRTATAPE